METVASETIVAAQDSNQEQQHDHKQNSIKQQNIVDDETEELLGSVTTFPKTSGIDGPAVRTSARVIHKLRMDSTPLPHPEKKEAQNETSTVTQPKTPSQPKPHVKVQWSNEEMGFFFEALNEHGRDFEQISRIINSKMRRKSPSDHDFKTKDHVRQVYDRTFQKASRYLKFSDDVKKPAQELYTLINYGEMKRKVVMSKEKIFLKFFKNLVYKGFVMIRWKGKNIKVKTPSCRALRKLNQLEGNTDDNIQLPQRIDVNLRPVDVKSWGYVQSLAQNPRVRMVSLPLHKRVASLIVTMQQKWQMNNSRLYEKYVTSGVQRHGVHKIGEELAARSQSDVVQLKKEEPMLCFMPPRDTVIHRPMVQLNELMSSYNICLNSYEERIGAKTKGESLCSDSAHLKEMLKHPSKRMRLDSASEKKLKTEEQKNQSEELGIAIIDHKSNDSVEVEIKKTDEEKLSPETKKESPEVLKDPEDVLQPLLSAGAPQTLPVPGPSIPIKSEEEVKPPPTISSASSTSKYKKKEQTMMNGNQKKEQPYKPLIDEETLKKTRKGWNLMTVADLTIGDLYLMFGSDSKLALEYDVCEAKVSPPETSEAVECKFGSKKLGNKLKNLLSIAGLMEGANNSLLNGYLSSHSCDRNSGDNNHRGEHAFKQPVPNYLAPRSQHQARWRLNQRIRQIPSQIIPGVSSQHVVREVYQTPPLVENQASKVLSDKTPDNIEDVTKIIDEKIQGLSARDVVNRFSESSGSSMRSFWDCFPSNILDRSATISEGENYC